MTKGRGNANLSIRFVFVSYSSRVRLSAVREKEQNDNLSAGIEEYIRCSWEDI
jgi:hypothetical protein